MPALEDLTAAAMLVALTCYALTALADFGAGVWQLIARRPEDAPARTALAKAIAPIWEANHVWLIVVVVLLFVAFPRAYAAVSTGLHIPLTVMLIGIVLRGTAFVFRSAERQSEDARRRWGWVFAVSSAGTPFLLGAVLAAVASGTLRVDPATGVVLGGFFASWLSPFAISVGVLTVVVGATLAAVYLGAQATGAVRERARRWALLASPALGVCAFVTLGLSASGAPRLFGSFVHSYWGWVVVSLASASAIFGLWNIWSHRMSDARLFVAGAVALLVLGFGFAQYPYIIYPDVTFAAAAAEGSVLRPLLITLALGSVVALPSLLYLYRVFRAPWEARRRPQDPTTSEPPPGG